MNLALSMLTLIVQAFAGPAAPGAALGKLDVVYSPVRAYVLTVQRGGSDVQVQVGQFIQAGDVVRTIRNQTASVEFSDGTTIVLGELAELKLTSATAFELRAGSAFYHLSNAYQPSYPLLITYPHGVLSASAGDFETRVSGDALTVFSLSSMLSAAHSAAELEVRSRHLPIDEGFWVRLGPGGSSPETFRRPRLIEFEREEKLFGQLVAKLREKRFPFPDYEANKGGASSSGTPSGGGGSGQGASPPAHADPFSAVNGTPHGW